MKQSKILLWLFLLGAGITALIGCYFEVYPYLWFSIALFALGGLFIFHFCRFSRYSPLVKIYAIAYALPFIHLIPYLWFDWSTHPRILWGLKVNPYMINKDIITIMAIIGGLGFCGFALGMGLVENDSKLWFSDQTYQYKIKGESLGFIAFFFLGIISLLLSWAAAPSETIFQLPYAASISFLRKIHFHLPSAWMLSYGILIWLFADALHDPFQYRRRKKIGFTMCVLLVIVVWLQFLRGDRECVPLIVSFVFIWLFWKEKLPWYSKPANNKVKLFSLAVMAGILVVASYFFGAARSLLSSMSLPDVASLFWEKFSFGSLFCGTWSAVLMTPLSVAGDYFHKLLAYKWGRTYIDFILSIPPSAIAHLLGYARPIDGLHGPAWGMRYGIGGTHAVVVPFINFGFAGVFFIMMLIGYGIARIERYASNKMGIDQMMLLGILVMAAPHWFWYGEKIGINAIIIWALLYFTRRFCAIESSFRSENKNISMNTVKLSTANIYKRLLFFLKNAEAE
jgi:hypothetical protein